jgi:acyl-CoA dehydrogenase
VTVDSTVRERPNYSLPGALFTLPPEIQELKLHARGIIERECISREPAFLANDSTGMSTPVADAAFFVEGTLPPSEWAELERISKESGLYHATLPEEYGGLGLGVLGNFVLQEECNRSIVGLPRPNVPHILYEGTEDQRERYLEPIIRGEKQYSYAQTEPDAGSDPGNMTTTAVLQSGEWVINGTKTFISLADKASFFLTLAVTDPEKRQHGGITMFIVDAETPGLSMTPLQNWQSHVPHQFTVYYDDVRVPVENVLGEVGGGFRLGQQWLAISDRLTRGAMGTGFISRGLEIAAEWAKARVTFGQPLSERQAIQWMLVDCLIDVKCIRAICYECAARADAGEDVRAYAAMAKYVGANWGHRSLDRIMQILGGMGESLDTPIPHWYHVIRHGRIGGGTDEIQRILMARAIFKEGKSLWLA